MRRVVLLSLLFGFTRLLSAGPWISIKTGPFQVFSDGGPKETRERAAELEQFRFALGQLLGLGEMHIDPPLHVFVTGGLAAHPEATVTRTGALAITQSFGPLTLETRQQVARILLDQNAGRMPPELERGLIAFLSTTEVHGAKVTWGAPPPASLRTPEWALVDWLITNPDTYGNVRVLLANLEKNVEERVAYANALHQTRTQVEAEVAAYLRAGQFRTIDAPSRPLSPERDLAVRTMAPEDVALQLADFLDAQSEQRYRELLATGKHKTEAEEGLALLALQRHDVTSASELLRQAIQDGSKNAAAMVEYARLEPDRAKSQAALQAAVSTDPNSAEAHFLLGQQASDPAQQIQQWTLAAKLAPRKQEYWAALAQVLVSQKQWVAASQAWHSAEQAAVMPADREKFEAARIAIEGQRLDAEEAEKRAQKDAEEREIRRLKAAARAELRAAEAKVGTNSSPSDAANAVPWDQLDGSQSQHIDGQLIRVDCSGPVRRVVVRTSEAKLVSVNARQEHSAVPLTCGVRKPMPVSIAYTPKSGSRTGVAGDAVSIAPR